jgi:hypothetical protein
VQHTESEWASGNGIVNDIQWLYRDVAQNYPAVPIPDVYPTHRSDIVFQKGPANDVELPFVPAEAPGRFQQMDQQVFGELKARARAEFGQRMSRTGQTDIGYHMASKFLPDVEMPFPPGTTKKPGTSSRVSSKHEPQQLLSEIILELQSFRIFNQRMTSFSNCQLPIIAFHCGTSVSE